ncbi:MAG: AI-2E family transporter [Candidatus Magasanikbacteria bacterium]|jgi:predicted PurR-regulated permease PerM|nr:AI-2E family transporter [Candidatus Magasanikbacteria bacterium]MBT4315198.1 AI-2E family transporter [Candidatus Magasanikbacteria bacterium]MBT4547345.1 AI-2E family transporter [Candidatus Magasanikbacteria bacterium]MBT6819053.1 AI-2E family transporter [Candidatus Magasanikbacteria bacterium]
MPKVNKNKLSFTKMRSSFFFGLIIILTISILYIFKPFIYPIFWAAVIAMMFYPIFSWLNRYMKAPNLSAFIVLILVIVTIFLPLVLLSSLLVNESVDLYQSVSKWDLSDQVQDVSIWVEKTSFAPYIEKAQTEWANYAANTAKSVSVFLFNNIKSVTQNSLRFIFMMFIMLYTLFYFLKDGEKMLKRLMHLSPLGDKYEKMLYEKFRSASRATLKGTFIIGSIQGILGGILFWATGIEGAFIWGIIMVALSIIPAIGSVIIWFPAGIIMLIIGNIWQGVVILVIGTLVISMIDNLLRPPMVGKDIQMHPLLVLFSTLGGILIFGISGFIIGPILAALFVAIMTIYDHHYRNELQNN